MDNFPKELLNKKLNIDGLELLKQIPPNSIKVAFFDPQYRGILEKQNYGNEGKNREKRRANLQAMNDEIIINFIQGISNSLLPSGHLFLWIDKFHLCEGVRHWFNNTQMQTVDLLVWEKHKIGMGYRTRNKCEFLLILQKEPIKAKGVWTIHDIPNVIGGQEVNTKIHPHAKPINLQERLIQATSKEGDIVLDPAFGSGSVFEACKNTARDFIGTDIGFNAQESKE